MSERLVWSDDVLTREFSRIYSRLDVLENVDDRLIRVEEQLAQVQLSTSQANKALEQMSHEAQRRREAEDARREQELKDAAVILETKRKERREDRRYLTGTLIAFASVLIAAGGLLALVLG